MEQLTLDKIKFKKKDEKPCKVTFAVDVPADLVAARQDEVAKEYQKVAQLPGFRAGKAPLDIVRRNFADKIKGRSLEDLLKDVVTRVIQEKQVTPVTTPTVDELKFDAKGGLSFILAVEKSPDFKVRNYTRIPVEKKAKKITDSDVTKELDQLRERNSQLAESKDPKVENHHFAVVDYAGTLEGQALPELKGENQLIHMAAPQTIQGFAEGILGLARGESKDVGVTFPAAYPNKKLAGKPVNFTITLRDIKEKKLPALDDEFAKDLGVASLQELKAKITESLQSWADRGTHAEMERQIYDHLVKENPIPVPDSLVDLQAENMADRTLAERGRPEEPSPEERKTLAEKARPEAERQVRLSYLIGRIAKEEKQQAEDPDLRAELKKAQERNPGRDEEIAKYFERYHDRIMNQITEEKVLKYLLAQAKVKEIPA